MKDFITYVCSFYHPDYDPVYEFKGLTVNDVIEATMDYLDQPTTDFAADSIDREHVAQILVNKYGYEYP